MHTTVADQQTAPEDGPYSNKMYKAGESIPWITEEAKTVRRAVRPPVQPEARRGDIMIRDLRTWHAGMPNNSGQHRIMLGLGYQVSVMVSGERGSRFSVTDCELQQSPFHPNHKQRMHLPLSQQEFLLGRAEGRVEVRANFYEDDEFRKTKRDTDFDIGPQYGADE